MSSQAQLQYLRRIKIRQRLITITQIAIFIIFIGVWELLARLQITNTFLTSSPSNVINTLVKLYQTHELFYNIYVTIYETFISFSLAALIGLILASLFWWFDFLAKVANPYLTVLNSLPKIALGPIIIIWAGANTNSIIVMALLIATFISIINFYDSFINADQNKIQLLKSFKASRKDIFIKAILPGSLPSIINTLKINISLSLIGVTMGEFLVSKKGIGYLIMYGSQVFNLNLVITGIILLAIVAYVMYYIISYIEKEIVKISS